VTTSDTNELHRMNFRPPRSPGSGRQARPEDQGLDDQPMRLLGCSLSLLDIDERMIALLDKITILRSSFTDIKRIPERCAIGFIEGGVANEANIRTLRHFRENCDVLISVGACAIWVVSVAA